MPSQATTTDPALSGLADPLQSIDEAGAFSIDDIAVDAEPHAESDADLLDAIAADSGDEALEQDYGLDEDPIPRRDREVAEPLSDTGDLYGVHTPPAADPVSALESQDDEGRNWIEALETDAAEGGPAVEHVIDVSDDSDPDRPHHKTDTRDRPIADRGSGGVGGL